MRIEVHCFKIYFGEDQWHSFNAATAVREKVHRAQYLFYLLNVYLAFWSGSLQGGLQ